MTRRIKRAVGVSLLAMVAVAFVAGAVADIGWLGAVIALAGATVLVAMVWVGIRLLVD